MAKHDFSELYARYPELIAQMPRVFTSHQFILELARQNQALYIQALYACRNHKRDHQPVPFMIVHGALARKLSAFPELIRQVRGDAPSRDIFNQANTCAEWVKIQ